MEKAAELSAVSYPEKVELPPAPSAVETELLIAPSGEEPTSAVEAAELVPASPVENVAGTQCY